MALQEVEEAEPGGRIRLLVALLGGVASRRIEEHRLLREPPVAVARAADALQRLLAGARVAEREAQSGIEKRRGLARPGRPNEHVPGKLTHRAPLASGHPEAGLAQLRHRVFETLAQHLELACRALG